MNTINLCLLCKGTSVKHKGDGMAIWFLMFCVKVRQPYNASNKEDIEKSNNHYQDTSDIPPHLEIKNAKEVDSLICINNIQITSDQIL